MAERARAGGRARIRGSLVFACALRVRPHGRVQGVRRRRGAEAGVSGVHQLAGVCARRLLRERVGCDRAFRHPDEGRQGRDRVQGCSLCRPLEDRVGELQGHGVRPPERLPSPRHGCAGQVLRRAGRGGQGVADAGGGAARRVGRVPPPEADPRGDRAFAKSGDDRPTDNRSRRTRPFAARRRRDDEAGCRPDGGGCRKPAVRRWTARRVPRHPGTQAHQGVSQADARSPRQLPRRAGRRRKAAGGRGQVPLKDERRRGAQPLRDRGRAAHPPPEGARRGGGGHPALARRRAWGRLLGGRGRGRVRAGVDAVRRERLLPRSGQHRPPLPPRPLALGRDLRLSLPGEEELPHVRAVGSRPARSGVRRVRA